MPSDATEDPTSEGNAAQSKAFWNRITESKGDGDDLATFGTVTRDQDVVALRDQLERNHVFRLLDLEPEMRVLDIGGGAGRFAIPVARRAAHVTLVDVSEALLRVARQRASEAGIRNVEFVCAPAQEFEPTGTYERILVMGLCTYLSDDELARFVDTLSRALAPGGRLILKEPVSTDGTLHLDRGASPEENYLARFRPREAYAEAFGERLRCTYQRASCSHPFPWFMHGTDGAVAGTRTGLGQRVLRAVAPFYVRLDPWMLRMEIAMRRQPVVAKLLADVPVLTDIYVFEKAVGP
ncbi:MAG: class I SAM-dependent methyltransferase [Myxococcales bacterium]|nr:class I SAM-dependent methyltransferase [Myxococcales bacterium]